jgi:NADH-quinone oxidoreductase subunit L
VGGIVAILGVGAAYTMYVRRAGITLELRDRSRRVHDFLEGKWYFDELFDLAFVRPTAAFGHFGRTVVESTFVQGVVVGGAVGVVRVGTSFARAIQSGYLRAYALLLLMGLAALALYFLIVAS